MMNPNKRGVALDMKSTAGKAALISMIEGADVVIETYRRGAVEAYGAGDGQVRETCPRLVYCSLPVAEGTKGAFRVLVADSGSRRGGAAAPVGCIIHPS